VTGCGHGIDSDEFAILFQFHASAWLSDTCDLQCVVDRFANDWDIREGDTSCQGEPAGSREISEHNPLWRSSFVDDRLPGKLTHVEIGSNVALD
jgi:hypothetical protein